MAIWLSRPIILTLQPDQLDLDQWPLAEALVETAAQDPARGIPQGVVVMAHRRRQAFHRVGERIAQCGYRRRTGLGEADQADLRRRREPAAAIDDQGRDDAAVAAEPPPLLQDAATKRQQALAVLRDAADRHLIYDCGAGAVEPDHIAVLYHQRVIDLAGARQLGVGREVA